MGGVSERVREGGRGGKGRGGWEEINKLSKVTQVGRPFTRAHCVCVCLSVSLCVCLRLCAHSNRE
jgi:hypothetical protein